MSTPALICPVCSARLERPATLRDGALFRCPHCSAKFRVFSAPSKVTVQKPEPPVVEEVEVIDEEVREDLEVLDADEALPAKRKMKESQRMKMAYWGLGLEYAKFVCVLANMLILGLFMLARAGVVPSFLNVIVSILSVAVSVGLPLLGLSGALLCFWVPKRAQARHLIQIAFALDAGAFLVSSLGSILVFIGGPAILVMGALSGMAGIATVVACVLFILFLRALASYLRDKGTESESMEIMVRWIIMTVLAPVLLTPLGALLAISGKSIFGAISALLFFGGLSLTYLVFYFRVLLRLLNLIAAVREKIASRYELD